MNRQDIPPAHLALELINHSVLEALGFKPINLDPLCSGPREIYQLGNLTVVFTHTGGFMVRINNEPREITRSADLVNMINEKAAF